MSKSDARVDLELIAYTTAQAAAVLGIDYGRMCRLVRVGTVPHLKIGERTLIGKRALEQWLTDGCLANVSQPSSVLAERPALRRVARA